MEQNDPWEDNPFVVVGPKQGIHHARVVFHGPNNELKLFKEGDEVIPGNEPFYVGLAEDFPSARHLCQNYSEYVLLNGSNHYCLDSVAILDDGEIWIGRSNIQHEEGSKFIIKPASKNRAKRVDFDSYFTF